MVFRVFVEKKKDQAHEAKALYSDVTTLLGINKLKDVRIINRYDAENITAELFEYAKGTVFSEPQLDIVTDELDLEAALTLVKKKKIGFLRPEELRKDFYKKDLAVLGRTGFSFEIAKRALNGEED